MITDEYTLDFVDKPEESAWGIIGRGIDDFNKRQAGESNFQRLCFVIHSPGKEIVGGALGELYWNWFHLDLLWVKEEYRGRGFGRRLLVAIEDEARKRGAKNIFLDTFSFQAPGFYQQYGYEVFGELEEFPPGQQRFYLKKRL